MHPVSNDPALETQSAALATPARLLLPLLLVAEILAISFAFDAKALLNVEPSPGWLGLLAHSGDVARWLSLFLVVSALLALPHHARYRADLRTVLSTGHSVAWLTGLQLVVFGLFFVVTAELFAVPSRLPVEFRAGLAVLWLGTGSLVFVVWCLALAPLSFWRRFLSRERSILLLASVCASTGWAVASFSQHLWSGLASAALHLCAGILGLFFDQVLVDTDAKLLGVESFAVVIGYPCSGYEGIGLITLFTALYLHIFRAEFRFPQALLLFPLGILAIWVFNLLRIVALIAIGARISPEIALGGFHSQAGWISFLLVSLALLYTAHRTHLFSHDRIVGTAMIGMTRYTPTATLLPLLTVLAAGLLASAFSSGFDWLYPVKIVAGAVMLALCWKGIWGAPADRSMRPRQLSSLFGGASIQRLIEALLGGVVVFALWLLLVNPDPERDLAFGRVLQTSWQDNPWLTGMWLLTRVAGAVVLVPLVEELAFRGYLLSRLSRQDVQLQGALHFHWFGFLASSVLFGLLHGAWIAGIAAGMVYALMRYRDRSVRGPIVAHATTNLLLAAYVLATGAWSLW